MHLRPCLPGEEPKLWDLYQTGPAASRVRDVHQGLTRLKSNLPIVVEYGGEVIGYANLLDDGEIGFFFVSENWQGRGIGTLLMQRLHAQARERALPSLTAQVCQTSRAFFLHWGFSACGDGAEDRQSVRMTKGLAD